MRRARDPVQLFLNRLSMSLDEGAVVLTLDVVECAEEQLGWDEGDVFAFLRILDASDFERRAPSTAIEGGTMWLFLPATAQGRLFVRICERGALLVISLHRG